MNARTIKTQIKKAGFDINEWKIKKFYNRYEAYLTTAGLSDNERQQMTGDQANAKKQADQGKLNGVASLFDNTNVSSFFVEILTV